MIRKILAILFSSVCAAAIAELSKEQGLISMKLAGIAYCPHDELMNFDFKL
jgi:hypothetical protein